VQKWRISKLAIPSAPDREKWPKSSVGYRCRVPRPAVQVAGVAASVANQHRDENVFLVRIDSNVRASDEKRTKVVARRMMLMRDSINVMLPAVVGRPAGAGPNQLIGRVGVATGGAAGVTFWCTGR
jgi:hypothetical protein